MGWIPARYRLFQLVNTWVREKSVDVIEVPDYQGLAAGWGPLAAPVVARLHGSESYFAQELGVPVRRGSFWIERASLRRVDFWSSVCKYTADKTRELFQLSAPSAILYNPVEVPSAPALVRRKNQVIFSGTLTPKKGIVSLIRSWPTVKTACPDAELHVYGKDGRADAGGSMRQALQAELPAAVRESVIFHGHVTRDRLFEVFRSAGLAVFPSYAEAFAIAPLEAMACGCATIYSQRGSGPELLEQDKTGLLVDPDQPAQIAESIIRTLRDDRFAERLGTAGRKLVEERFSLASALKQNIAFYAECVDRFRLAHSLS
jgi:glycosyltransferase involved in cell wall biosynthesis